MYEDNYIKISKFVKNNNENQSDAEGLFQDAMMVLVEKLRDKNYELSVEELQSFDFLSTINDAIEDKKTYLEKLKGY